MVDSALFSHDTDDWGTPYSLFEKLNKIYKFDVDAAASRNNALCNLWFGPDSPVDELDALKANWRQYGDTFFLNPPYSMCKQFMAKVHEEYLNGCNIIVLVPARTDTKWWHAHVEKIAQIHNIKGRLKFSGSKNSAPFPSVILTYLGALNGIN